MKVWIVFVFAATVLETFDTARIREGHQRLTNECRESDALKPFSLCMNVKLGWQKEDGDIDKDALRTKLSQNGRLSPDEVNQIVNECGDSQGSTAGEAADTLSRCIYKKLGPTIMRH